MELPLKWVPAPLLQLEDEDLFTQFNRIERNNKCCDVTGKSVLKNEDDFITVGQNKSLAQQKQQKKPKKVIFQYQQQLQNTSYRSQFDHSHNRRQKFNQAYRRYVVTKKTKFKDSIVLQPDWTTLQEFQRQFIEKTPLSIVEVEDLMMVGNLKYYNKMFDKAKAPNEIHIPQVFEDVYSSSTNEDPYLKGLIQESDGNENILTIYTTDQLLYSMLTLKYSVYPWDMIVQKKGNCIVFDKNDENKHKLTYLEMQCINENTTADMPEDEKVILNQCEESSMASGNWHLFSTKEQKLGQEYPLPENLKDNQQFHCPTDFAFKYVKCTLKDRLETRGKGEEPKAGETKMNVIVKSRVDALNSEDEPILVKSLNECDTSTNWRQQLEKSAGQLTSALYSANTNNLAKWLLQAQMTQVNEVKIGFIVRQQLKEANKHSLVQVETYSTKDMKSIINFKQTECWYLNNLHNLQIAEYISKLENGQYVLVKSAFKSSIKILRMDESEEEKSDEEEQ